MVHAAAPRRAQETRAGETHVSERDLAGRRPRESTARDDRRRNPRYSNSRVWSDSERLDHRDERDRTIEDAGLVSERQLGNGERGEQPG